jgi:uridine kinase
MLKEIAAAVRELPAGERHIIAIDGRCAAGKSTLAAMLGEELSAPVFHMDDFFLRPHQRTEERLKTPGGNVDYERFDAEILRPLREGADEIAYRPYDCRTMSLLPPITVKVGQLAIVEGAYACHPSLNDSYALRVFLTVSPGPQLERIRQRNGEAAIKTFRDRWIPMEEAYFLTFQVEKKAQFYYAADAGVL